MIAIRAISENKAPAAHIGAAGAGVTTDSRLFLAGWPGGAFVLRRHWTKASVRELLDALSAIGLRCVDIAFGVGRDAVQRIPLAGLPAAAAKAVDLGQCR